MEQYMTTKEIAELAGCSLSTVTGRANRLFPELKTGRGNLKRFGRDQATAIMKSLPVKNADLVFGEDGSQVCKVEMRTCKPEPAPDPEPKTGSNAAPSILSILDKMQERQENFMLKIVEMLTQGTRKAEEPKAPAPKQLPSPDVPECSSRDKLSQVVRKYSMDNSTPHADSWSRLYLEYRYRYHIDLKARAKKQGIPSLDVAERLGRVHELLALAVELYGDEALEA